ncbi:MAG TPA: acetolactate synthase small subunit, partial [Tepidisphaeraceae bacterium]|nr:acetolactate synthase small subunit [Tepidisphaeraceae bacterium]
GPEKRSEVVEIVNLFRGRVVDVARDSVMLELSGTEEKLEAFVELMRPYGIEELARTGVIAMARGTQKANDKTTPAVASKPRTRSLNAPPSQALPPS